MNFQERKNGPIYFYSENLEELHAVKNFGMFCAKEEKAQELKDKAGKKVSFAAGLEKLLSLLSYNYTTKTWYRCVRLHKKILEKSKKVALHMADMAKALDFISEQKSYLLKSWAKVTAIRAKNSRPFSTLRIKAVLRKLCRSQKPNEKIVIEAVQKIVQGFKQLKPEDTDLIIEHAGKGSSKNNRAFALYTVSEEILPYILNRDKIPREHAAFCKFQFPTENINGEDIDVVIDYDAYKIVLKTLSEPIATLGEINFEDISSMILNNSPKGGDRGKTWLRINGRKIRKSERLSKKIHNTE